MSGNFHLARSPDDPTHAGGDGEARTCGERIDDEIRQARVPSRRPELQDFDKADPGDRNRYGQQPALRIGQTEGQPDQDKGKGVFAVLAKVGMRPVARRTERGERYGCGEQPGK